MTDLGRLRFSLVGPGAVGTSFAYWACARGARLRHVGGRDPAAAASLAERLGGRATDWRDVDSEGDDWLWITVADGAITDVARQLARRPQAPVVLHASGLHGSEVLSPLGATGSAVGVLHPLRAFPEASTDPIDAAGCFYASGGDPEAVALARALGTAWGGVVHPVEDAARPLYHLAATLAAGGVVTLLAVAEELAARAGLPEAVRAGYRDLATGALAAACEADSALLALTGPAARGDDRTLRAHRAAVLEAAPDLWPAIRAVVQLSAELAPGLSRTDRDRLLTALDPPRGE